MTNLFCGSYCCQGHLYPRQRPFHPVHPWFGNYTATTQQYTITLHDPPSRGSAILPADAPICPNVCLPSHPHACLPSTSACLQHVIPVEHQVCVPLKPRHIHRVRYDEPEVCLQKLVLVVGLAASRLPPAAEPAAAAATLASSGRWRGHKWAQE
jgi:hypothetical protein